VLLREGSKDIDFESPVASSIAFPIRFDEMDSVLPREEVQTTGFEISAAQSSATTNAEGGEDAGTGSG
jgi:hypothetical protein